jgi:hypothetical protein
VPLKKLLLKAGVNRENTRYTSENGWYDCDKIRFRQGTPEKIGGWQQVSTNTFLGVARSLWNWATLASQNLLGIGTNLKFYIEQSGTYYDITPIRSTVTLTNPFTMVDTETTVAVLDVAHGARTGDFVTFSNCATSGGLVMDGEFQITVVDADNYTVESPTPATSNQAGGGGAVDAVYQINTGAAIQEPVSGWGAGPWSYGTWGAAVTNPELLRLWSQSNFGEDLIFGYNGGEIYYWDATNGLATRGVLLSSLSGAADVPVVQNNILVSDINRFVFALGCNDYGSTTLDPMLIRWSDQEDPTNWAPAATNQAGSLRLSRGSLIVTGTQARQEVLVWTDAAVYSLQYLGAPAVWGAQLVGENTSIVGQNAVAYASGTAFWMGVDKFYKYDGRTQTLRCDLRQHIFSDINQEQFDQVFAGTNEGFNEAWWFYCSADSTVVNRYVVYNYLEDIWYFGTMERTAWLDSGLRPYPVAATYSYNIVNHESGVDDNETATTLPIESYVGSAEFDLDDGHTFCYVWRVLPDITFRGSTATNPSVVMTLLPMKNSGSGYTTPASTGGENFADVTRSAVLPIEAFTGQIFTRVRGRQLVMRIESSDLGVTWQLGAPRLDMRPDGRR